MNTSPAKMAEVIQMAFRVLTLVGLGNHVLDGVLIPSVGRGIFECVCLKALYSCTDGWWCSLLSELWSLVVIASTVSSLFFVQDIQNSWNASVCFNFCDKFLQHVKDTVQMDYDKWVASYCTNLCVEKYAVFWSGNKNNNGLDFWSLFAINWRKLALRLAMLKVKFFVFVW